MIWCENNFLRPTSEPFLWRQNVAAKDCKDRTKCWPFDKSNLISLLYYRAPLPSYQSVQRSTTRKHLVRPALAPSYHDSTEAPCTFNYILGALNEHILIRNHTTCLANVGDFALKLAAKIWNNCLIEACSLHPHTCDWKIILAVI